MNLRDKANNAAILDSRPIPKVTFKPAGHLIVGHILKLERVGSILLPTGQPLQKQFETHRLLVLAVGDEVTNVKVDDIVLISDTAPAEVIVNKGQQTVMLRDDCFLGIENRE